MKLMLLIIFLSLGSGIGLGFLYNSHAQSKLENMKCHIILNTSYESDLGEEKINAVISISFANQKGNMNINATLITAEDIRFPISQRIAFSYTSPNNNEYILKSTDIMNKNVENVLPKNLSPFMRSMLYTHFINPDILTFRITTENDGNHLISSNVIPFGYCNNSKGTLKN